MKRTFLSIAIVIAVVTVAMAVYVRMLWPPIPFINPDSGGYLSPPFTKVLTDEWHKGERPMQYLLFLYYSMSERLDICRITIVQHVLGICTGGFLFLCLMFTARGSGIPLYIRILIGSALLWMYWLNPNVLYYEHLVGPESYSMFLESFIILSMSLVIVYEGSLRQDKFWMLFIFLVLFISNPMPKFFIASIVITALTAIHILRSSFTFKRKLRILLIPGAIYFSTVFIPEFIFNPDSINQDRTNIEWKQMTYTHFDILMSDTAGIPVSSDLKLGLMRCYLSARKADSYKIIGFSSDDLMWGEANRLVEEYYSRNNDSVFALYKGFTAMIYQLG